ncbi:uncharacterized protein THITE_2145469 [Thermothielavioides terrestris NRRL 8126]|uniref:Uncharacterized protein n=1 Tax=Thermothielavioides terrestris (strain ATCC 38088 / NRRL 8126) TaxID=578455 RepID=G2R8S2_THETT|nr:uncharacterized protein THITE_2145469 [Thermothielavioides terrestris NRRL 8126]AEO68288.1 hypothetical protein THITE_2145469 [Thermothielavioides terrestris NRRL 8126]
MEARTEAMPASVHSFATNVRRAVGTLLGRDHKDCSPEPGINLCEKPVISSTSVTWIIVGAALGAVVLGTLAVLVFLHFRRRKRDKREDMEDRFQMSDYGLDDVPSSGKPRRDDEAKWSNDGSSGFGRRSREPLQAGTEPKYHGGQSDGHLNPFDDAASVRSGSGSSYPPSVYAQGSKREGGRPSPLAEGR